MDSDHSAESASARSDIADPAAHASAAASPAKPLASVDGAQARGFLEGLQLFVGAAASLGAVIYVVLTTLYQRFYSPLQLAPEDVGLTQDVILARSAGGVIAVAGFGAFVGAYLLLILGLRWITGHLHHRMAQRTIIRRLQEEGVDSWSEYVASRLSKRRRDRIYVATFNGLMLLAGAEKDFAKPARLPFTLRRAVMVVVVLSVVTLTYVLVRGVGDVDDAALKAAKGETVKPVTVLGVTLFGIESRPCVAEWIGSTPRPRALATDLHCLGSDGKSVHFRTPDSTISVPSSQVVIRYPSANPGGEREGP